MTSQQEPEWIQRMQSVANDAIERASESTVSFQRLMLAVASADLSRDRIADELTRFGQEQALTAYSEIAEVNARTLSRFAELVSIYQFDYVGGLISDTRMAAIGRPPAAPSPPTHGDATEWLFWFQRYTTWVTDQQAWNARLYRALVDEAASDGISEEAVRSYGTKFVRHRLPTYMADIAEASFDSFCDLLAVTDDSVRSLTGAMLGSRPARELTVDVEGTVGSTVSAGLVIENNHPEAATVSCVAAPADGFGVVVTPADMNLTPGDAQKVIIYVTLPDEPTDEAVNAGIVRVTGHDDEDLAVYVQARVSRPQSGAVTVRVLDADT